MAAKATGAPFVDGIDKNTDAIRYAKFLLGETANLFNVDMFSEIKFPETYGLIVADPHLTHGLLARSVITLACLLARNF